jgi:arylsulfatase A-like enzyme
MDRVLEFVDDDAIVVVTGDHGEEFDHDGYGHARLYDECVRVPLLARGIDAVSGGDTLRQVDLPPTVLSALDSPVPDGWEGRPADGTHRDAFLLNHSPEYGKVYAGLRTEQYKLIHTMDEETLAVEHREGYDVRNDPGEEINRYPDVPDRLEERLTAFLDREDVAGGLREREFDTSMAVEDRLSALGYK